MDPRTDVELAGRTSRRGFFRNLFGGLAALIGVRSGLAADAPTKSGAAQSASPEQQAGLPIDNIFAPAKVQQKNGEHHE